jgi:hypothetical protein
MGTAELGLSLSNTGAVRLSYRCAVTAPPLSLGNNRCTVDRFPAYNRLHHMNLLRLRIQSEKHQIRPFPRHQTPLPPTNPPNSSRIPIRQSHRIRGCSICGSILQFI